MDEETAKATTNMCVLCVGRLRARAGRDTDSLTTTSYVGNLPFSFSDAELRELFSKFGNMNRAVVGTDKFTGKSLGFGFVAFETRAEAEAAMAAMHGYSVNDRQLRLDWDPGLDRKTAGGGRPAPARDNPY